MIISKILLGLLAIQFPLSAMAVGHPPVPDSLVSVNLEGVTVKAAPVIRKADRDVYLPSAKAKERSGGGLSLLDNMQLPGVGINNYLKTVTVNGQTPELRINNRRAKVEDIVALDASAITRVEVIDNPGVRYGDAPAVINVIVKNPETGGYALLGVEQGLSRTTLGNYNGALSINHGYSQFEFNGFLNLRKNAECSRKYYESFLPAGHDRIYRTLTDTLGRAEIFWGNINAAYSYSRPGKTGLYVSLGGGRSLSSLYYEGRVDTDNKPAVYNDRSFNPQSEPHLHIYFDQNIGRKQTLVFDTDVMMGFGRDSRRNNEYTLNDKAPLLSISNSLRNRSFGLSAEAMYVKELKASRFTAGLNYKLLRNREEYVTGNSGVYHQQTDREAIFAEYMHKFGSVSLTGGIRGEFWSSRYAEGSKRLRDFLVTPDFTISWSLKDGSMLKLNYNSNTTSPSLTEMTEVCQTVDAYQVQEGNPDLKPYQTYNVGVTYALSKPRFAGSLYARWTRSPDAIMEYSCYTSDGMIRNSWLNAVGGTRDEIGISPRIVIIPDFLTVNGTVGYYHFRNHGPNYRLIENSLGADVSAQLSYRGFTLSAYYHKNCRNLWGHTVVRFEDINIFSIRYHCRNVRFSASILNPIGAYRGETKEKRGELAWSKMTKNFVCKGMILLGVSYRIEWGRKRDGINRRTTTSAEVESVKAAGK